MSAVPAPTSRPPPTPSALFSGWSLVEPGAEWGLGDPWKALSSAETTGIFVEFSHEWGKAPSGPLKDTKVGATSPRGFREEERPHLAQPALRGPCAV